MEFTSWYLWLPGMVAKAVVTNGHCLNDPYVGCRVHLKDFETDHIFIATANMKFSMLFKKEKHIPNLGKLQRKLML